jgi:hypothetical protein
MKITSVKRSIPVREAELSEAFLELQFSINRLAQMARLAECQLNNAVGGLEHLDGICIEVPETKANELAVFAVTQTAIMAQELADLHDRLRCEGARAIREAAPSKVALDS